MRYDEAKPRRESVGEQTVITRSEAETFRLAKKMAGSFGGKEVVLLIGALGAGKTIFAKGLAAGLGLKDHRLVCSPSFTLLNIYQAKFPIFHFDLYRLEKSDEIADLGLEDCLDKGVVIVEWAEKIPFALRAIRIVIEKARGNLRTIRIFPPR